MSKLMEYIPAIVGVFALGVVAFGVLAMCVAFPPFIFVVLAIWGMK